MVDMITKYIVTTNTDPYINLATEQALFDQCENDTLILYLWQNDNTIVIGRNQDPYLECRADEFIADGGRIARRRSGGGAVYHDLGNLNYSVICRAEYADKVSYQRLVASAMEYLGFQTEYNGRNDILIENRKFSGNAVFNDGSICCQHGTLLVDCNISRMEHYLTPNNEKMERNHVRSVSSRVINLSEVKPGLTISEVISAFIESNHAVELTEKPNNDNVERLYAEYSDKKWILGGTQ